MESHISQLTRCTYGCTACKYCTYVLIQILPGVTITITSGFSLLLSFFITQHRHHHYHGRSGGIHYCCVNGPGRVLGELTSYASYLSSVKLTGNDCKMYMNLWGRAGVRQSSALHHTCHHTCHVHIDALISKVFSCTCGAGFGCGNRELCVFQCYQDYT